jgi:uncharacterized protein YecE (DUF72 family)
VHFAELPLAEILVGFSGWTYAPWRGVFYPPKLAQKRELEYASRKVTSIEINGTFYRLQKPKTFQQWYEQTPPGFKFSLKASQFITHRRRLQDVEQPLANFFAQGLLCLKEKLGPILWQFPPSLPLVDRRFEDFIKLLPHTSRAAGDLAARHDSFVEGKSHTDPGGDYPIRHAFEFRHPSFRDEGFLEFMKKHKVALVFADAGAHSLELFEPTANFVYASYSDGYPEDVLERTARRIQGWAKAGLSVYVYFDNDEKAHAPRDAQRLSQLLGLC